MNTTTTFISDLLHRGVTLGINDSGLQIDAPKGELTKADVDELRRLKPELLRILTNSQTPAPCPTCQSGIFHRVPGGQHLCANCIPLAPGLIVEKVLVVATEDGWEWCNYEFELSAQQARRDAMAHDHHEYPGLIWNLSVKPRSCPACQSRDAWWDLKDGWHCSQCNPATKSLSLMARREELLRRISGPRGFLR